MKDRTADGGVSTPEQLQAEKAALKDENILVVLGSLHALLKGLWVGSGWLHHAHESSWFHGCHRIMDRLSGYYYCSKNFCLHLFYRGYVSCFMLLIKHNQCPMENSS